MVFVLGGIIVMQNHELFFYNSGRFLRIASQTAHNFKITPDAMVIEEHSKQTVDTWLAFIGLCSPGLFRSNDWALVSIA